MLFESSGGYVELLVYGLWMRVLSRVSRPRIVGYAIAEKAADLVRARDD